MHYLALLSLVVSPTYEVSTMSRKHFQALASAIAQIHDPVLRRAAAERIADVCRQFNGRFDRERFLRACGVNI